tara:strand:- start:528 stop:1169 length:642 start_codon:yes stop_codon:yes gene_type:complete
MTLSERMTRQRQQILDEAEALFASYGYHAVSVRDITREAGVRVASINDQFGSKEKLFYEVIRRRATVVNAQRDQSLELIDRSAPRKQQLHALIAGFFEPLLEKSGIDSGWRNYLRLVAQMIGSRSPILLTVVEFYNPVAQSYLQKVAELYPELEFERILRHWQFVLATYFSVFADNFRVNTLSDGKVRSSDFVASFEEATAFIHAGLESLFTD